MSYPLFKTTLSLSANGTCKTNLRGIFFTNNSLYDYVNPIDISANMYGIKAEYQNLDRVSTPAGETWTNKIKYAYNATSDATGSPPSIRYFPMRFSYSRSGTILIRVYVKNQTIESPIWPQFILSNGSTGGYGISIDSAGENVDIYFVNNSGGERIAIGAAYLSYDTWYHYGVRFQTIVDEFDISVSTTVWAWEDGVNTVNATTLTTPLSTPNGDCVLFDKGGLIGERFFGRITDFAFFESQLSEAQIQTFARIGYT